ncbi:hypothetical protein LTR08_002709 [Meristemomyces frigidus]|nr:hypothetical protein LTR08_002709 [Meristemomyces frigidus]
MAATDTNTIAVKNLQLPAGVVAPDVWGKLKEQPALVSVTLILRGKGFSSAASKDELDDSTIHYGQLAKSIRAKCSRADQTVSDVLAGVGGVVELMASKGGKVNGEEWKSFVVAQSIVEITLPKASMAGDGVTAMRQKSYDEAGRQVLSQGTFAVHDVKIMTLVGVNAYERTAKQPLIVSLWVSWADDAEVGAFGPEQVFGLERKLVKIIEETSYETLETLADHAINQLQEVALGQLPPGSSIRLRIEKPRAIAFADAPVVEVLRQLA